MIVQRLVLRHDPVDVEIFCVVRGVRLELLQRGFVSQYFNGVFAHPLDVADIIEIAGFALYGDLRKAAGIGGNDGHTRGHRFESGQAETFIFGRQEEELGDGEDVLHLLLFADKTNVVADVELAAKAFGTASLGPVADEEKFRRHFLPNDIEYAHNVQDAFHFSEVGRVEQNAFAVGGDHPPEGVDGFAVKPAGIDKVINDLDFLFDIEDLVGLVTQVLGDGRDGIRLVDREGDDRREGLVAADQGDIRAVERGDHRYLAALGLDDLLGHVGGGGVRDRVMDVKQVQMMVDDDVDKGAGQGGFVWRIVEQRVRRDANLVVKNICVELIQPNGLLIGYKVNLVALIGQRFPQLCRKDAAATEGRITNNTYTHRMNCLQ